MFDLNGHLPQLQGPQGAALNALAPTGPMDWRQQYHNALMDWRQGFDPSAMSMKDYRQQRPDRGDFRMGNMPVAQPGPIQAMPVQQMPMAQQPMGQMPMVGQSYGVQGMTPAASPFGLPRY